MATGWVSRRRSSISFAGGGFMGMYHLGVRQALQDYSCDQFSTVYGTSVGSAIAVMSTCNIPAREGYKFMKDMYDRAHSITWSWLGRLGVFHPKFDLIGHLRSLLESVLPHNAHRLCRGKVEVSLTVVPEMRSWIVTDFNTRAELIQAVVCSCYLPLYCGLRIPRFRGRLCCEGGLSNNLPFSNDPMVVTVSPFSGECDICPSCESESYYQLYLAKQTINISCGNIFRGFGALLFLHSWNEMDKIFEQGYNDTIRFLRKEGIIPITLSPDRMFLNHDSNSFFNIDEILGIDTEQELDNNTEHSTR